MWLLSFLFVWAVRSTLVGGMCSMCCHMGLVLAFMHLYSIFNLRYFLYILFYNLKKSGIETPNWSSQWYHYQHILTVVAICYESDTDTEGTNFRIMFVCLCKLMRMFCKSPEVTLCGWRANKPSINKQTIGCMVTLEIGLFDNRLGFNFSSGAPHFCYK